MMRYWPLLLAGILLLNSCSPTAKIRRELQQAEQQFNEHAGFMLYDPSSRTTLLEYNSSKYFTPASNTKIFTLYGSLQLLGDSVPALKYTIRQDSLIFWGTGDPSFLYDQTFSNTRTLDFLKHAPEKLYFSPDNFKTKHFGPGWAWDDYVYYYSPERSPFPIYGNVVRISSQNRNAYAVIPTLFQAGLQPGDSVIGETRFERDQSSNHFVISPGKERPPTFPVYVPYHSSPELIAKLLTDTLKRQVEIIHAPLKPGFQTLYSVPMDSLYKTMMQESDNFIAEQLMLLCAGSVSDSLDTELAIKTVQKRYLFDLPDPAKWVDGSGLSRYNLFTPRTIVRLWDKIYQKVPRERLFSLLAAGSQSGTIKGWYKADKPYIYGKTGSLSNVHTLSGYLITRKEKVLIFSFMNSNFIAPSKDIRKMMQQVLQRVRDEY